MIVVWHRYDYASRINVEFQKAGVRGISIFFAAGDSGTGGNCTASKGKYVAAVALFDTDPTA